MKFDVFGRIVLIEKCSKGWKVFYYSPEGKKRPAEDIIVPPSVSEEELLRYMADQCHEWSSEKFPDVRRLD